MTDKNTTKLPFNTPLIDEARRISRAWLQSLEDVVRRTKEIRRYHVTINPTTIPANSTSEQMFTVEGVNSNDFVIASKPTETTNLGIVNCRVVEKDVVAITFMDDGGTPIDPPEETYQFLVIKV